MKIDWTEPAISDLQAIYDYIAKEAEYYANRFIERIFEAVEKLGDFPKMGRFVPETEQEDIRELLFHDYRIIYRVEKERVLILAVVHGSRDLFRREPKPWDIG
ncbi:type II toxin-antitoxin system RelE/ParE family toxin [bacterium]|nr:type II toxin-antitoxin system RelE/ParE family toxin [bacterium]